MTRLPTNVPNGTPVRMKKQRTDAPKHSNERSPLAKPSALGGDPSASGAKLLSSKPQKYGSTSSSNVNQTDPPAPSIDISLDASPSARRVGSKKHETESYSRTPTSLPSSRASTQTLKNHYPLRVAVMTKQAQPPQQPGQSISTKEEVYQAFNIPPEKQSNFTKTNGPRQSPVDKTPSSKDEPTSSTKDSPIGHAAKSHKDHIDPIQKHQPVEIVEQHSSSSNHEIAPQSTDAGRTTEEAIKEAEMFLMDRPGPDHVTTEGNLPEDHPVEWLAAARQIYSIALPPFVSKQKVGVRKMVELPLAEGQESAEKIEMVYRFWDAVYSFATIDINGKRSIVKVFRGGNTPYRPWLGPQAGFSETAVAFAKQVPRGLKSSSAAQSKRVALPKGWAIGKNDEDYNPAGRRSRKCDWNDEADELDEQSYEEDSHETVEQVVSERSSIEEDNAAPETLNDPRLSSNTSNTPPPPEKSLPLLKGQDDSSRLKHIKRSSIGSQQATTNSGKRKRSKRQVDSYSESDNPAQRKQAKITKTVSHHHTTNPNLEKVSHISNQDSPALEAHTLTPYKQTHTTLRIALIPYPNQFAIQRLRSCMTMATFFDTVIGISGYRGDKAAIFGISATFDGKPDDDADKSMVIRQEWPDMFDVFLEMVDGAGSWTEDGGGKCGVSVKLLLTEG